jgi:hypothetical protein
MLLLTKGQIEGIQEMTAYMVRMLDKFFIDDKTAHKWLDRVAEDCGVQIEDFDRFINGEEIRVAR